MRLERTSESALPAIWGYRGLPWLHRYSVKRLPGALLPVVTLIAAACTPAFDWRSVRLPETQLVAQMPCRPARFQRDEVIAGTRLRLFMLSCEAGGVTYGVATADVADAGRVEAVLAALASGAASTLRARDVRFAAFKPTGVTPFSGNVSARLHGTRPDGVEVEESLRLFARGTRIFQVNAIGASLNDDVIRPFEDGLRFDLENPVADSR